MLVAIALLSASGTRLATTKVRSTKQSAFTDGGAAESGISVIGLCRINTMIMEV